MKKIINYVIVVLFICTILLSGCGPTQIAIGIIDGIATLGGIPSFKKKLPEHAIYTPGKDKKETIISELGNPSSIEHIGNNREVLIYKSSHNGLTYLFALTNEIYQDSLRTSTRDIKNDKARGVLKSECIRVFPCFQEPVAPQPTPPQLASYTPAVGDTFAKVVEKLGRPDDEFLLKDERGEPVPNTNMVWYFTVKDDQLTRALSMYVRDGIVSKVEERTNDKPPYTIGFYKSYLYLCATMAYRAPKFAFALNEPSPIN